MFLAALFVAAATALTGPHQATSRTLAPIALRTLANNALPIPAVMDDEPEHASITPIDGQAEFQALLDSHQTQLIAVKFFATWCRSCKALAPKFQKLADAHRDIKFVEVNFDENRNLCRALGLLSLPTVQIYAGNHGRIDSFGCGPSKAQMLRDKVALYSETLTRKTVISPDAVAAFFRGPDKPEMAVANPALYPDLAAADEVDAKTETDKARTPPTPRVRTVDMRRAGRTPTPPQVDDAALPAVDDVRTHGSTQRQALQLPLTSKLHMIADAASAFRRLADRPPPIYGSAADRERRELLISQLSPPRRAEIEASFRLLDSDLDGEVSATDLSKVAPSLKGETDLSYLELINRANPSVDGNTSLDLEAFLGLLATYDFNETARRAFCAFDPSGTGFIPVSDLKTTLESIGEEIEENLARFDIDGDGQIAPAEFLMFMLSEEKRRKV